MGANLDKYNEFKQCVEMAWAWLSQLRQYDVDYELQKTNIRKGELPAWSTERAECEADCRNDKQKPGYYYSHPLHFKKEPYNWELRESLKEKWGFYPLQNPTIKTPPAALTVFMRDKFGLPCLNQPERKLLRKCYGWDDSLLDKSARPFNAAFNGIAYVDGREKDTAAAPSVLVAGPKKKRIKSCILRLILIKILHKSHMI